MSTAIERPESEADLAALVARAAGKRTGLEILGGGTRPAGNPVADSKRVSVSRISGIDLYEPGALTIVARAGTPLAEIEAALAAEGQHLPFEPADHTGLFATRGKSTIGGVVAAGVSGPRRIQAGGVRDALIGVRFVTGEGEIVKNGGRVMKNVTGYDLVKLLAGSHGTLGILTELSFKVLPKPETAATLLIEGLDDERAVKALAAALGSPFDVSGAAHDPRGDGGRPLTMIRIEGFQKSVAYRSDSLRQLLAESGAAGAAMTVETGSQPVADRWNAIRDVGAFHDQAGAVWRLSVKPSDGPRIVEAIGASMDVRALYDWGGGLVWLLVPELGDAGASLIRGVVAERGGHATLFRAPDQVRERIEAFQPENPVIATLSENLRRQFDPHGILNPGRMLRRPASRAA